MGTGEIDEVLVADLARAVVGDVAAEELVTFAAVSRAYFRQSGRARRNKDGDDQLLGFGTGELVTLVAPVALVAANEATKYVANRLTERGVSVTGRILRRLFRLPHGKAGQPQGKQSEDQEAVPVSLTDDEWADVRRIVEEVATRAGVAPGLAETIAEAVVGHGRLGSAPQ